MEAPATPPTSRIARDLVLDELFDLTLYQKLSVFAKNDTRSMLEELSVVETTHLAFWQDYFRLPLNTLDTGRKIKLSLLISICRLFGDTAIHLILEAIEVYGIRKYLDLWKRAEGTPLEAGLRTILQDEFGHEDAIVSRYTNRNISPEKIRSVFLGFNDGLVEILGAVSGFFAVFQNTHSVLVAGLTVAVAGALSMGAGSFAAATSEDEVRAIEEDKRHFLDVTITGNQTNGETPLATALIVCCAYFIGAAVPILPVISGALSPLPSIVFAGLAIVLVSVILSFLSGMRMSRRILTNIATIIFAVGITSIIGFIVRIFFGIAV